MNGVVFAIDREEGYAVALDGGHDHFAGRDQNFFICQRNLFARLDRLVRGWKADDAYCRGDDHFGVGVMATRSMPSGPNRISGCGSLLVAFLRSCS